MYLLDTNVWATYLRGKNRKVMSRMAAEPIDRIVICSIVLAELYYGVRLSAKPAKNRIAVETLVAPYTCLPFAEAAADRFSALRVHLRSLGTPIGPYDMQIAAIALASGCTVVTHNTSEFGRVPGLPVEDWET